MEIVTGDLPRDWLLETKSAYNVGMDIETTGLDKTFDKIACVQINIPNGSILIKNLSLYPSNLLELLHDKEVRKIFHYAPFDLEFLMRDYRVLPRNIYCTKIAAKLIDPNKQLFLDPNKNIYNYSLSALVYTYLSIKLEKELATSNWMSNLSPAQIKYAENDVLYLYDLYTLTVRDLIKMKKLTIATKCFEFLPTKIALKLEGIEDIYGYS